jgi:hypothetical protein
VEGSYTGAGDKPSSGRVRGSRRRLGVGGGVGESRWGVVEAWERGGVVAAGKNWRWVGDGGGKTAGDIWWCSAATQGWGNHGGEEGSGVRRRQRQNPRKHASRGWVFRRDRKLGGDSCEGPARGQNKRKTIRPGVALVL